MELEAEKLWGLAGCKKSYLAMHINFGSDTYNCSFSQHAWLDNNNNYYS